MKFHPLAFNPAHMFNLKFLNSGIVLIFLLFLTSCSDVSQPARFQMLNSLETNVTFSNDLESTPEFNIINYLYFYDGGGVSIGDINNDGLADLYFTANMKPNKLYLNKGNFEFEDITDKAGVAGTGEWTTGTTMADINGDGLLDIYVSVVNYRTKTGKNQLYINNGDSTFTEQAERFGLDFQGYSKQTAFFDYDSDGDLDMYLLNHAVHSGGSFVPADQRYEVDPNAGDRLYRNDGGHFTEVTEKAGIYSSKLGYGLAVSVSDLNNDGCPDIYISNDFHENDYLYRNNCDGTFEEVLEHSIGHTSRAAMGNDIADINNDGLTDIFVADMLPYEESRLKSAVSSETYKIYTIQRQYGYHPQLIQNTLQINLGESPEDEMLFAEIAQYAGVNATDWSWAPLLFDMDNDGLKDLFVTNGIYRRPNDLDYLLYIRNDTTQQLLRRAEGQMDNEAIERMPHVKITDRGFLNNGDNTFTEKGEMLGFTEPSYSNGAAYGDLDNDGDLDLVINHINSAASIFQNMTREQDDSNYLKIKLEGNGMNAYGIGSKVTVYDSSSVQLYEIFTTRGFLSSVEPYLTIGLGDKSTVDSLRIRWAGPGRERQTLYKVKSNQTLTISQANAEGIRQSSRSKDKDSSSTVLRNVTDRFNLDYRHEEDQFVDYNRQHLTPFMLSSQGPGLTSGDVNGDGLKDFFVCGAKGQSGTFFLRQKDGSFIKDVPASLKEDASFEDVEASLFDANQDGALDLYVVSGGNEGNPQSKELGDRLYLNDGNGNFLRMNDLLPPVYENGAVAVAADYDGDGDNDLFVGNRSVPGNYGVTPNSYIYENQGNGQFKDVTDQVAPELKKTGMVTDARWSDVDGDGRTDLIVVGEWMPITVFLNKEEGLVKSLSGTGLEETEGWWQSVEVADIDGDGDSDIVAGNMGTNSYLKATVEEPIVLYLKDFNKDGQVDPILGYTKQGKEYPVAPRDELLIPFKFLRSKFRTYKEYAGKTIRQIFGDTLDGEDVQKKRINMLHSVYLENDGNGRFSRTVLPQKIQWAPVFSFVVEDFDGDGRMDLLTGGNFYDAKPSVGGRYDASYGWYVQGREDGTFQVINREKSGFIVHGEVRDMVQIDSGDGEKLIVVARNDKSLLFFATTNQ